ncbi:UDP-glucose 4-epimerase [Aurantimicrobium sp. INA4]|uniref:NAD-dependent epimerase/dehydratase family protein n=1 Tax=Aurantimicrobium sp. INA4 TaxID=2986279 RepID=UPI00248FAEF7|nr:NAD-dependent epimerase/dehydratase family protein [Aurantimicrobium sp. INA4]BDU11238.1 UDP-glucose 4-epimerase [Aurantimicrobium sp. INA4]
MSKYLVSGSGGFLGFYLAKKLAKQGHSVVAVDVELQVGSQSRMVELEAIDGIEVIRGDLTNEEFVSSLPRVDGVYHMAALNGTQKFYSDPWKVVRHSTIPTITLLERYGRDPLEFFFYAGSSEAYASSITKFGWEVPTKEDVPLGIQDPKEVRWSYGGSKLHGEIAVFAAAVELGTPAVVGRFHNAYGPNMGIHHVIPDFIERGKNGVFELYGANNTRSFIYIDDAIESVIAVANNAVGEVVNIGSPNEINMIDLAHIIMEEAGWSGEVKNFDAPVGSVLRRAPDISRLAEIIDVEKFVNLNEGIRRTLPSYL